MFVNNCAFSLHFPLKCNCRNSFVLAKMQSDFKCSPRYCILFGFWVIHSIHKINAGISLHIPSLADFQHNRKHNYRNVSFICVQLPNVYRPETTGKSFAVVWLCCAGLPVLADECAIHKSTQLRVRLGIHFAHNAWIICGFGGCAFWY